MVVHRHTAGAWQRSEFIWRRSNAPVEGKSVSGHGDTIWMQRATLSINMQQAATESDGRCVPVALGERSAWTGCTPRVCAQGGAQAGPGGRIGAGPTLAAADTCRDNRQPGKIARGRLTRSRPGRKTKPPDPARPRRRRISPRVRKLFRRGCTTRKNWPTPFP